MRFDSLEHGKDYYLNPNSGKLVLLRVQHARGYRRTEELEKATSWSEALAPNPFVNLWRAYRDAPIRILAWTYEARLTEDASSLLSDASPSPRGRASGRLIDKRRFCCSCD